MGVNGCFSLVNAVLAMIAAVKWEFTAVSALQHQLAGLHQCHSTEGSAPEIGLFIGRITIKVLDPVIIRVNIKIPENIGNMPWFPMGMEQKVGDEADHLLGLKGQWIGMIKNLTGLIGDISFAPRFFHRSAAWKLGLAIKFLVEEIQRGSSVFFYQIDQGLVGRRDDPGKPLPMLGRFPQIPHAIENKVDIRGLNILPVKLGAYDIH